MTHLTGQIVVNRRCPAIDIDRGLVAALFIIPHVERTPPGSTHVGEFFKIVDGKIRSIEEFSFTCGTPIDSRFQSDIETGKPDTKREQNMHPSFEFLKQVLSGPPPIMTVDLPQTQTGGVLSVRSNTLNAGIFPIKKYGLGRLDLP